MKVRKFACFALGCKVNQAEVEKITRSLLHYGFLRASLEEKSDICIINTCTVTSTADQKSRQKIRKVIKKNPEAFIIVTGCYAQAHKEVIESIPGVHLVLNNKDKNLIQDLIRDRFPINHNKEEKDFYLNFIPEGRTRAFLKVQEGCDNYCSYCIIPFVRGKPRSLPAEEILRYAKNLCNAGYKEIVLTGINLGAYGKDLSSEITLAGLSKIILESTPVKRLRISSIEPLDIDKSLLNLIKDYSSFCPHLHIPLQHGHNEILKSMNRNYSVEDFRKVVKFCRSEIKNLSITTDVMVGFPGENQKHFEATRELIEELEFSRLHVFSYSPRKGTRAFHYPFRVDEQTKKKRSRLLLKIGRSLIENFCKRFLGYKLPVLLEHRPHKKTGLLKGLTGNYIPLLVEGDEKYLGQIVPVKLQEMSGERVLGKIE